MHDVIAANVQSPWLPSRHGNMVRGPEEALLLRYLVSLATLRLFQERTQELFKASQELRELSARILRAQDEERRRIARELHDGAGQLLAALGMEACNLARESDRLSARAALSLSNIESFVAQMTKDIRTMSHLLYPPLLDEVGLQSALKDEGRGMPAERLSEIQSRVQVSGSGACENGLSNYPGR